MHKIIKKAALLLTALTYVFWFSAPVAFAQQNSTSKNGQALEIAPPVLYLTADPGQQVKAQILIRDISSGNLIVKGTVNDFVAGGVDGTPKILLEKSETTTAYSIVDWVAPLPSLLLIPKEIKAMTATINVPKDASPGGHYGVIRFTSTPPTPDGSGVSLAASIGVLVLLTVNGEIKQGLTVDKFTVGKGDKTGSIFESAPIVFTQKFKNTGNVHVQPTGQVIISDMFGKKFAAVNVNVPPGNVLPDSTRQFKQNLDKSVIGGKRMFGKYSAKLSMTYGDKKKVEQTISFWVIPFKLVLTVILVLVGLFFLLRFLIKRYNRRILNQGQKNRRP